MKILVVEDDPKIATYIANGFREAAYNVDSAADGTTALDLGSDGSYDAAIVDIMLPGLDGLSVIERWRASGVATPVLILSARRSVDDRVRGLRAGGDDYLVKPFSFTELLARIEALIRRSSRSTEPTTLSLADLHLDLLTRTATRAGQQLQLQAREFGLLEYLLRNHGRIVSKTSIFEHVYDYSFDPGTNVLDVLVHRLRSKIDKTFSPKLLHTVRGMGYVLKVP
ncbi:MAG: response regulator transcription factor [Verrucomicrobiales bacterium]|nr:response regulator transcription factor [Verrucomicrobiales bacterium]